MFRDFFRTVRKIYLGQSVVLWLVMLVLPVGISIFLAKMYSSHIILHVPVGVVNQDKSSLADKLVDAFKANPVLSVALECHDRADCEHAVIRGEIHAFVEIPYDLERKALRLETPVVPLYSSGQNYMTNTAATNAIRSVVSSVGADIFTKGMDNPLSVTLISVGNDTGSYEGFLVPGLISAIFHLAGMLAVAFVFCYPFRDNRVREYLKAAGGSRFVLWLASLLPVLLIQWLSMIAVYVYIRRLLVPMGYEEFVVVSAAQFCMLLACSGFGVTFAGATGSMRSASSGAGFVGGPAFAYAGQSYPVMAMTPFVRGFAFILPLTHLLNVQSYMLFGAMGMHESWGSIKILLGMALFWNLLGGMLIFKRWKKTALREGEP